MRAAPPPRAPRGRARRAPRRSSPPRAPRASRASCVPDPQRRVERGARVLRDVGDGAAAQPAHLGRRRAARGRARRCSTDAAARPRRRGGSGRAAPSRRSSCPSPDSPTSPSTSPGSIAQRDLVDDVGVGADEPDARSRTSTEAAGGAALMTFLPVQPDRRAGDAVGDEVRAHREQADGRDRQQHRPRLHGDREPVLVDHQAPVGGRRLQAEAEEADRRDEPDRVRHAQAELDEQRARHVRQQLAEDDPRALLADRLGGLDEVALDDLLRRAAHDARDARRVRRADASARSATASARSPRRRAGRR